MDTEQEQAFVRAFVHPDRRERYLQLLTNPKRRDKVLGLMYHALDIISAQPVASRDNHPEPLERLLRQKGAGGTCYLISPEAELDQREMPLREALDMLITEDGVAVACCVPGRLAYYKAEDEAYILERPASRG